MVSFLLVLGLWSTVYGPPLWAQGAECMVAGGKFVSCRVTASDKTLAVTYDEERYQSRNREIPAEKIRRVTEGKADKNNAQQSLVFGPLMFLSVFDRRHEQAGMFGIDYLGEEGVLKYLLIRLPADRVYTFGTSLKKLRGEAEPVR
ncbi:MAG: hypothetical protein HY609_02710 [Deltaproteobacteria bacterium]|nr:hypothetical protein [Deltaproteobacteria bacterium]